MKISILGAGEIGSMIGGLIQKRNPSHDVRLIVRGSHGKAICESGHICLLGPWGMHRVRIRASTSVTDIANSDYVLVTVKSQSTETALVEAAPFLGNATVVSIQNGINKSMFEPHVSPEKLVMAMTTCNMALVQPGAISLQLRGVTVVGPTPDNANQEASHNTWKLLRSSGLHLVRHPNGLGIRYNKLIVNAVGCASCLSASNFITEAVGHRAWRNNVGQPLMEECLEVMHRARIRPARIPGGSDIFRLRRAFSVLDKTLMGTVVQRLARLLYNRKPILFSLYQDLLQGKRTEVDFINGHFARYAGSTQRTCSSSRPRIGKAES